MLLDAFMECIKKGELTESVRQGLIVLIPKPEKDFLYLENWRPISLINSDYKLFASLYAKRFNSV